MVEEVDRGQLVVGVRHPQTIAEAGERIKNAIDAETPRRRRFRRGAVVTALAGGQATVHYKFAGCRGARSTDIKVEAANRAPIDARTDRRGAADGARVEAEEIAKRRPQTHDRRRVPTQS
jgi:hypothetical protein